ncbi:glycosyltransferase family 2 protein [Vibrio alginolyticus]
MIVIPMAGLSSRFFKAGYSKPKFMLEAQGKTIFRHSIESFIEYFESEKFLFIIRGDKQVEEFVLQQINMMNIRHFEVVSLNEPTRGQAETVAIGLKKSSIFEAKEAITIFNIDTFRIGFKFPKLIRECDGYLEVFKGEGSNWSFVKSTTEGSDKVEEVREKEQISNLCCTGLYHFSSSVDFFESYNDYIDKPKFEWEKGELYVAPLFNYLIGNNKEIRYDLIERDKVIFCGIPEEYEYFLKSWK